MKTEYIDIRKVKHNVEHFTIPAGDKANKERIVEELHYLLTKKGKCPPT